MLAALSATLRFYWCLMSRQGCHQCFHKSRQFRFCSPFIPATTGCAMHQIPIVTTHGRPSIPIITLYPQPYQCRQKTECSREAHGWVLVNVSTGTSRRISRNPGLLIQEKIRPTQKIHSITESRSLRSNKRVQYSREKQKKVSGCPIIIELSLCAQPHPSSA